MKYQLTQANTTLFTNRIIAVEGPGAVLIAPRVRS